MSIKVTCSHCKSNFNVKEEHLGKKGNCPKCGNIIEIKKEEENNINNQTKKKKKPESRVGFAILLALAIGAFFLTGLSFAFYLLTFGAVFLFVYPLYEKYLKIEE